MILGSGGAAALRGRNDFRKTGYGGPCPPGGTHRYVVRLYAPDDRPDLGAEVTKERLIGAMEVHVLAEGGMISMYSR